MSKKDQVTTVNLPLPKKIHAGAKSKAALAGKTLQDWLAEKVAEAVK